MLAGLITLNRIVQHPYVTGEIVVGNLHERDRAIWGLRTLPRIPPVDEDQFHDFLRSAKLYGTGLGFVDIHILAAANAHGAARIWTRDRRMLDQARRLELLHDPLI